MKKLTILLALVLAAVAPSAIANTIKLQLTSGANYAGGGQFTATATGQFNSVFQTFCVESQVDANAGQVYLYTVSQMDHSGNPLTIGTAWLYKQFSMGALPGYTHTPTSAGTLQAALWHFQSQSFAGPLNNLVPAFGGAPYDLGMAGNVFTDLAVTQLGGMGLNPWAASNGMFGVDILDLWTRNEQPAQAVLHVPDGGATMALLGLGLIALAAIRRRIF